MLPAARASRAAEPASAAAAASSYCMQAATPALEKLGKLAWGMARAPPSMCRCPGTQARAWWELQLSAVLQLTMLLLLLAGHAAFAQLLATAAAAVACSSICQCPSPLHLLCRPRGHAGSL